MQFSFATISLALLTLAVASPVPKLSENNPKAAAKAASSTSAAVSAATSTASASTDSKAASGASVLTPSDYNTIQISSGTAGDAEAKANALFAKIDQNNLAGVSAADLAIIDGTHDAAEDAEEKAFDPAIAAASGAAADALNASSTLPPKLMDAD